MTTAFVLSGGASLGAVQVGMLQGLAAAGITPDVVYGTSAGAINAAWIAGDPGLEDLDTLAGIWRGLRTRSIFPFSPVRGLLGAVGRGDALVTHAGLRRVVERNIRFERIEDAEIPLAVVATEVATGMEAVLRDGPVVDAVLASAAIPGVFSPVTVDGRALMDGGVVNNTPLSVAVESHADRIYVLPAGYACALEAPPASALGMALHALSLLLHRRLVADVAALQGSHDLRVIPPLCPVEVSPADFSHADHLITAGRAAAERWLVDHPDGADAGDKTRYMGLHRHAHRRRGAHQA